MNKETMIRDIIRNVMYGSRSALEHRETEITRIARCVQDGKMSAKDSIDRTADTMNTYKTVIKNLSDTATWKLLQIADGKPYEYGTHWKLMGIRVSERDEDFDN